VATLPIAVTFQAAGRSASFIATVPPGPGKSVAWETQLPAGRYDLQVSVQAPESANETNPGNENATLPIEVFLGRLSAGGLHYDIRADAKGLPLAAVDADSGKDYPLKITEAGRGIVYRFTTADNRTLDWDPLVPMQDLDSEPSGTASGSASSTTGGKSSPAAGALVVALMVALAAVAQRRRA
jgi:hypothetical protein